MNVKKKIYNDLCCTVNGGKCVVCGKRRGCKTCDPWMGVTSKGEIYCSDNDKCWSKMVEPEVLKSGMVGSMWGVSVWETK